MNRSRWTTLACLLCAMLCARHTQGGDRIVLQVEPQVSQQAPAIASQLELELRTGHFVLHDSVAGEAGATAVLDVSFDGDDIVARLVIPLEDGYVVRTLRWNREKANAAFVFAIKVRELLHGTLLELQDSTVLQRSNWRLDDPALQAFDEARPAAPRARPSFFVGAGIGLLGGGGGIPVAPAPALALSWPASEAWHLELVAAGPTHHRVEHASGGADVDEVFAALRLRLEAWPTTDGSPYAAVGWGLHSMGVRGRAEPSYASHSDRAWSAAGLVGVGYRLRLSEILDVQGELDALPLVSPTAVRFDGERVVANDSPRWLGILGLRLSL